MRIVLIDGEGILVRGNILFTSRGITFTDKKGEHHYVGFEAILEIRVA